MKQDLEAPKGSFVSVINVVNLFPRKARKSLMPVSSSVPNTAFNAGFLARERVVSFLCFFCVDRRLSEPQERTLEADALVTVSADSVSLDVVSGPVETSRAFLALLDTLVNPSAESLAASFPLLTPFRLTLYATLIGGFCNVCNCWISLRISSWLPFGIL